MRRFVRNSCANTGAGSAGHLRPLNAAPDLSADYNREGTCTHIYLEYNFAGREWEDGTISLEEREANVRQRTFRVRTSLC